MSRELYSLSCELKHDTDKAQQVVVLETGELMWIPFSQIERIDKYPDGTATVHMTAWIAKQKGLI